MYWHLKVDIKLHFPVFKFTEMAEKDEYSSWWNAFAGLDLINRIII